MSLSKYESHICLACNECGRDVNTGIRPDDDLHYWMNCYGWSEEIGDDGECQYYCPGCTREITRRCLGGEYD